MTPPPVVQPAASASSLSAEERNWAMIAHLSALAGIAIPGIGNVAGPLVVWLVKKDTMPFVAQEAKEALNFQITWVVVSLILAAISIPLMLVLIGFLTLGIAALIPVVCWVFCVIAGIAAGEGKAYRYPLTLRLVK